MTDEQKDRIEQEARAAVQAGQVLADACPYPFVSDEGQHFIAAYLVARPAP